MIPLEMETAPLTLAFIDANKWAKLKPVRDVVFEYDVPHDRGVERRVGYVRFFGVMVRDRVPDVRDYERFAHLIDKLLDTGLVYGYLAPPFTLKLAGGERYVMAFYPAMREGVLEGEVFALLSGALQDVVEMAPGGSLFFKEGCLPTMELVRS